MALIWMHPPRVLDPELVPEEEVTMKQGMGWMHADPPPNVICLPAAEAAEAAPAENDDDHELEADTDELGHIEELGRGPAPKRLRIRR